MSDDLLFGVCVTPQKHEFVAHTPNTIQPLSHNVVFTTPVEKLV